jgi:hypothetical protein
MGTKSAIRAGVSIRTLEADGTLGVGSDFENEEILVASMATTNVVAIAATARLTALMPPQ